MNLSHGVHVDRATEAHEAFICKSFRESLIYFGAMSPPRARQHKELLCSQIRAGIVSAAVAAPIGHPETFLGWAVESCGSLLFAYVPDIHRTVGIAGRLVAELFSAGPVRLVYWTNMAEEVRDHGFPLIHDWREFACRERIVDRSLRWIQRHTHERAA